MLLFPPIDLPPTTSPVYEEWVCGTSLEADLNFAGPRGGFESLCPEFRDTEHFRIHYAIDGDHAIPGWPDPAYLDDLAATLENTLNIFHETFGLPLPPSDGTLGGGEGLIDCYCWEFDHPRRTWDGFARRLDDSYGGCGYSRPGSFA